MSEEKLRSIEEIREEIVRIRAILNADKERGAITMYGKGKLSGLYFALGIKLNFDGEEI